jgi:uncharacterized membrane protein YhaH (DUF805 family)
MNWLIRPWRHAFDYKGRSPRREYWLGWGQFFIGIIVIGGIIGLVDDNLGGRFGTSLVDIPLGLFMIASLVAGLAATVRRLHDQDKSGWFVLIYFVPFVGGIILLILMLMPGTDDWNSYGEDPRLGEEESRREVAEIFS